MWLKLVQVQQLAVPLILQGGDVMVKSETGSGKTLTYLLPLVQRLQAVSPRICRGDGTHALLLAPTRELCLQVGRGDGLPCLRGAAEPALPSSETNLLGFLLSDAAAADFRGAAASLPAFLLAGAGAGGGRGAQEE